VLGTGNYAVVILASKGADPEYADDFFAIKMLKVNTESSIFSEVGRHRFFAEIAKTRLFLGDETYLVGYHGFGQTKTLETSVNVGVRPDEVTVLNAYGDQLSIAIAGNSPSADGNESVHSFLEGSLNCKFAGDFYVMTAETGTLGDLLLHEFPWRNNALYGSWKKGAKNLASMFGSGQFSRQPMLDSFVSQEGIKYDGSCKSGLGVLRAIDRKNTKLANQAILSFFIGTLNSIISLHNREDDDKTPPEENAVAGWAHRDIKPGNFLLTVRAPEPDLPPIRASDLGFVISASETGQKETLSGTKDPGVLALGTYLYRAPEQVESRYEVQFSLPEDGSEVVERISFLYVGDFLIEPGDLFESDSFFLANEKNPDSGMPVRTTVTEASVSDGRWSLSLREPLKRRANTQTLYSGDIVKLTGQHTDLFSLGAMLYLIASGGKNPEKFYSKCLEPLPEDESIENSIGPIEEIGNSCFRLALSVCVQPWSELQKEMDVVYSTKSSTTLGGGEYSLSDSDRSFVNIYKSEVGKTTTEVRLGGLLVYKTRNADRGLAAYLHAMRSNPVFNYYGKNKNGNPIPFVILYEIVKLMVRNKEHSYVSMGDDTGHATGYFSADLTNKVKECKDSCNHVLTNSLSLKFDTLSYSDLARTPDGLVVALRLGADKLATNGFT